MVDLSDLSTPSNCRTCAGLEPSGWSFSKARICWRISPRWAGGGPGADGVFLGHDWSTAGHVKQAVVALLWLFHEAQQVCRPLTGGLTLGPSFLEFVT